VELFEARKPKGQAIITEVSGVVAEIETRGLRNVVIHTPVDITDRTQTLGSDAIAAEDIYAPGDNTGEPIVRAGEPIKEADLNRLRKAGVTQVKLRKAYLVPYRGDLEVTVGQQVQPGDRLTEGPLDPQKVLELQGPSGVQEYLVREVQQVYKSHGGVDINDKHIEVIVRQMLRKRKVRHPGDTRFLPGQIVDKFVFEDENTRVRNLGGQEATADWILLGITEASLATESFLSAASFQKTTRVLTEAAVRGKKDELVGLKENVIIGRLIPAGTGLPYYRGLELALPDGTPLNTDPLKRDEREQLAFLEGDLKEVGAPTVPTDPLPIESLQQITLEEDREALQTEAAEDVETELTNLFPSVGHNSDVTATDLEDVEGADIEEPDSEA
ncbi:MAG: hypothetical protein NZ557_01600, partial [Chthonomonadaceae bacterium]|nr:hypothetical protein [Chthonomonadaceae bacterium]